MTLENPSSIPPSRPSPISKISIAYIRKAFQSILSEILLSFDSPNLRRVSQENLAKQCIQNNWLIQLDWLSVSKKRERERTIVLLVSWSSLILYGSLKTLYWIEYSEFLNFFGLSTYQTSSAQVIQNLKFWESLTICENKLWFM